MIERNQLLSNLIKDIRNTLFGIAMVPQEAQEVGVLYLKLSQDVTLFNALSLPSYFLVVDDDLLIHVVMLNQHEFASTTWTVSFIADYIWIFDSLTKKYTKLKARQDKADDYIESVMRSQSGSTV